MNSGELSASPATNRAQRRAADRQRRRRKGVAIATGASVALSGAGVLTATPASATTYSVTDGGDAGAGTLRQAVLDANAHTGPDTITFAPGVVTSGVTLTSGELVVTDPLTIDGPGVTLRALYPGSNSGERFFYLPNAAEAVVISGLTMTGGAVGSSAGAIRAHGVALTTVDVTFTGNQAGGAGALDFDDEGEATALTLTRTTFEGNIAGASDGGGLRVSTSGTVTITDSTFDGNSAYGSAGGGALVELLDGAVATVAGTTFSDNVTPSGQGAGLRVHEHGSASLTITDSTFTHDTAATGGGGLSILAPDTASTTVVSGSTFDQNSGGNQGGGGVDVNRGQSPVGGSVAIDTTSFTTNTTTGGGGAISSYDAGLSLTDVTLSGNTAGYAGAVYAGRGTAFAASRVAFTGNHAQSAGALYAGGASLAITDSTFTTNGATNGYTGALQVHTRDATITGTTFTGNTASGDGGALRVRGNVGGSVTITEATFTGNESGSGADAGGGAISLYGYNGGDGVTAVTIESSRFDDNHAVYDGGAIADNAQELDVTLRRSSLSGGNTAGRDGGAIHLLRARIEIEQTTITGNHADRDGGGISVPGGSVDVRLSTITGNDADGIGGGIAATSYTVSYGAPYENYTGGIGGTATIESSIVSGNTDSGAADLAKRDTVHINPMFPGDGAVVDPAVISADHSLIGVVGSSGVTATGGNLIGVDPVLGPLALNGGTTKSFLPGSTSPAKDAGDPAFASLPATDQRGLTRLVGGRVDIGSVEVQPASAPAPVFVPTPPTTTPPTTTPPSTPPTTAPPANDAPPAPPSLPPTGSGSPVFVVDGEAIEVPLPKDAPKGQIATSMALSATTSIAVTPDGQVFTTLPGDNEGGIPKGKKLNAPIVGLGMHWTRKLGTSSLHAAAAGEWEASGYWLLGADGGIFAFGTAKYQGSLGAKKLNQPIVGITPTPSGAGYWLVAADGGVFAFGDAKFLGSTGNRKLAKPIVSMLPTPTGKGYWLVARDGGVFTFGDATYLGSGATTGKTFVGAIHTDSGKGYWLLTSDGKRIAFGDAR
ncbi:MAG: hemagglutination domain protein [Actinomycetia bacterium]|nr:hemagglutination domain protein [Actinomycetes bacterium]